MKRAALTIAIGLAFLAVAAGCEGSGDDGKGGGHTDGTVQAASSTGIRTVGSVMKGNRYTVRSLGFFAPGMPKEVRR